MPEIPVNGRSVSYASIGHGSPVVLLHGGGASGREWQTLASSLSNRHLCLMPDFYGHGATRPWAEATPLRLSDYAEIVTSLIARHHAPCHLIGHAHGGAVALTFAADHPDAVASLTLIEPTLMHVLRCAGPQAAWREAHDQGTRHIAAVAAGRAAEYADELMPRWLGADAWRTLPASTRATIIATMPALAQFWASVLDETRPIETYAKLKVPTLLLRGSETLTTTACIIDHLAALMPECRLVDVAGAAHMLPLTHPSEVNAAIAEHLGNHPIGGG